MIKQIKLYLSNLKNNKSGTTLLKNIITLVTGTAMAQIIAFVFMPILTRLYGPEVYGVLGVYSSLLAVLIPIAALTYPVAIVLPKKSDDVRNIVYISIAISFFISTLSIVIVLLFSENIKRFLNVSFYQELLLLIPIVMFFGVLINILQQIFIRNGEFQSIAKSSVFHALTVNGLNTSFGLFKPFATTLIIITSLGYFVHFLFLYKYSTINLVHIKNKVKKIDKDHTIDIAKKYRDFPLYRAPEVFVNAISQNLPILMLTMFFGPIAAGFYSIAKKVLEAPIQLIGKSIGDVFYPKIAETAREGGNVSNLLIKSTLVLALVGMIPFGIIIIFGPNLFSIIFGNEWSQAGEYARWLAFGSYFAFINIPCVRALPVLSAQRFFLFFSITLIIARIFSLYIGGVILNNDILAIIIFTVSGATMNSILIIFTFIRSKNFRPII